MLESLLPIAGGIPLYRAVVYGRPGEEIANASDTFCADLIAMGTHGRRGVSRLFIGSTSHSVLALVERPLLFIKGTQYPEPTENLHITLAVDGSNSAVPQRNLSFARATSLVPAQRLMS